MFNSRIKILRRIYIYIYIYKCVCVILFVYNFYKKAIKIKQSTLEREIQKK